jgi:hypothetical protein
MALQAAGFNPYNVSIGRQQRGAELEREHEVSYARQRAVDRYVQSGDMSLVRGYMRTDYAKTSPITIPELLAARKRQFQASQLGQRGLQIPKRAAGAAREQMAFQ